MADDSASEHPYDPDEEEGGPVKSFLEHLEDLRWVLIKSISAAGIAMIFCFFAGNYVFKVLVWPLKTGSLNTAPNGSDRPGDVGHKPAHRSASGNQRCPRFRWPARISISRSTSFRSSALRTPWRQRTRRLIPIRWRHPQMLPCSLPSPRKWKRTHRRTKYPLILSPSARRPPLWWQPRSPSTEDW